MVVGNTRRVLTFGSFLAFFVFGFIDNLKGPTLPSILDEVGLSYVQGGTIVLGAYLGFLLATLLSGVLSDFVGRKAVLLAAAAALAAGMLGYSFSRRLLMLVLTMSVIGAGLGFIELGGNALIVDIHTRHRGRYLNLLTFFHGVGSVLAPLYAAQLIARQYSWPRAYQFFVPSALLLLFVFLLPREPSRRSERRSKLHLSQARILLRAHTILFSILMCAYVAVELSLAAWMVEFLQNAKRMAIQTSSLFLSLFFAGITVGRLLGSLFVDKVGFVRSMLVVSFAATICLIAGVFCGAEYAFFLPVSGIFLSIMFPTITAAVSAEQDRNVGTVLGVLFAFGGIGGMLGPWAVGLTSDLLGLQYGFVATIGLCLVMLVSLVIALRRRY